MIEKVKAGFASNQQDRIYREPDVLPPQSGSAPPPQREPTHVEREPEKLLPLSKLRLIGTRWWTLVQRG